MCVCVSVRERERERVLERDSEHERVGHQSMWMDANILILRDTLNIYIY